MPLNAVISLVALHWVLAAIVETTPSCKTSLFVSLEVLLDAVVPVGDNAFIDGGVLERLELDLYFVNGPCYNSVASFGWQIKEASEARLGHQHVGMKGSLRRDFLFFAARPTFGRFEMFGPA